MVVLGLNTALEPYGYAILKQEQIIDSVLTSVTYDSSENIMYSVRSRLEQQGLSFSDLTAVYCVDGPGSYTGLRIGLSFAKTIGLVHNTALFGISAMYVLAVTVLHSKQVALSVVKARKNEYNIQLFSTVSGAIYPLSQMISFSTEELIRILNAFHEEVYVVGQVALLKKHVSEASPLVFVEKVIRGEDVVHASQRFERICPQDGDYRKIMPQYSHIPAIIKP